MKVSRYQLAVRDSYKFVGEQKRRGDTNQKQSGRWGAASKLTLNLRHGIPKLSTIGENMEIRAIINDTLVVGRDRACEW